MKSEKKLSSRVAIKLALAVFSAVGLAGVSANTPALAWLPPAPVQDTVTYEQDVIPPQFDTSTLDPKADRARYQAVREARSEFESKVQSALGSSSNLNSSQQDDVRNWVGRIVLAEMTLINPDVQMRLGEMRNQLFRDYVGKATTTPNRTFLVDFVILPKVFDIAKKNYHPAARVNAIQIMNWLDLREGASGSQLPQPSRKALGNLLDLVADQNSPDYVVAAAMIGIQRQAELDGQVPNSEKMDAADRNRLVDEALKLLAKYEKTRTDSDPGYLISRRVVQSLDGLNLPENAPQFAAVKSALEKISADLDAGPWLRMDAMVALSEMPISDPAAFVKRLGQLVTRVVKLERKSMVAAQNKVVLEEQINEKTGAASAKKASSSAADRMADLGGAGAAGATLGEGGGTGGGAGSYGGMNFGMFAGGDLLPYHLYYLRTNVKLATSAAQQILGTADKVRTGLKFRQDIQQNNEAMQLINTIDAELKNLQKDTDIGLVEEKELTDRERRMMTIKQLELLDAPTIVRVLGQMSMRIEELENIVGKIELEGEKEDAEAVEAITEAAEAEVAAEASADAPDASGDNGASAEEGGEAPGAGPDTGAGEDGADGAGDAGNGG